MPNHPTTPHASTLATAEVEFRTQRHIQLFRRLQAQWQCYDAYARLTTNYLAVGCGRFWCAAAMSLFS